MTRDNNESSIRYAATWEEMCVIIHATNTVFGISQMKWMRIQYTTNFMDEFFVESEIRINLEIDRVVIPI